MNPENTPSSVFRQRLAWLPIPLLLLAVAGLWVADLRTPYESPYLLMGLNFVFSTLVSLLIAYLAARSVLAARQPALLMLGCGVLIWGTASIAAALYVGHGPNFTITIHNLGVWLSAVCHLTGAVLARRSSRTLRKPGWWLALGYGGALAAVGLVTLFVQAGWVPVFFIQGQGGTPLRQLVLGSAIAVLAATALLMGAANRRAPSAFLRWYSLGLALLAVGLLGVMLQPSFGGALGWTGRGTQYLGGVYMLIAAIASMRESGIWGLSLGEALRQSEERQRLVLQATSIGTFEVDLLTGEGRWNAVEFELLGLKPGDAPASPETFFRFVHPDDVGTLRAQWEEALRTGTLDAEFRIVRTDGQERWLAGKGQFFFAGETEGPEPKAKGRALRFLGVNFDITERRRAEEQRQHLLGELQTVLDAAPVAIWIAHDPECRRITGNAYADEIVMNVPRGGNISRSAEPGEAATTYKVVRKGTELKPEELPAQLAAGTGRPVMDQELDLVFSDGRTVHLLMGALPLFDAQGRVCGSVAAGADITQLKRTEESMRRSEAMLARAQRVANLGSWEWDMATGELSWSEEVYRILGLTRADFRPSYESFLAVINPEDRDAVRTAVDGALAGRPYSVEYRATRPDSTVRHILAQGDVDFDPAGKPIRMVGTALDITERKQAEEERRLSDARFQTLADAIPQLAWSARPDGFIHWYNRRWYEYTGTTPEQMEGWGWQTVHDPELLPQVMERWKASLATGQPFEMVFPLRGADGRFRSFLTRGEPLKDSQGQVIQWFGTNTEVDELKRVEAALRASEQRLRRFHEAGLIGTIYWNMEGKITDANDKFLEMVGYTREDLVAGRIDWISMTPPEYRHLDEASAEELKATGVNQQPFEKEYIRKDGSRFPVLVAGAMLDEARFNGVAFVLDITERKRAEEAVNRSQMTFSELIERSPFGTYIVDSRFCIALMNVSSQEGAFRNVRPVIGRPFDEAMRILWPEPVAAEIIAHFRHTLDTGEPYYSRDFINPRHDAEIVEAYEWELHRMTLPDGQFGVICYYYDSTKLREAEAAAREAEERLRLALEAADLGTWDLDLATGQAVRSLRHDQIFGYQEPQPQWTLEIALRQVLPEDRQMVLDAHTPAEGKAGMSVEARVRCPDGSIRWINSRGRFYYDDQGRAVRIIGVVADITERKRAEEALGKRAEEALRLSEQEFRSLAEAMPQIVWATRPDGWNIYFNQQWVDYTGMTMEESYGHGWNKPFHPDDQQRAWEAWQRATQYNERYSLECRLRRADGAYRWWLVRGEPMRGANGEILKWFGTCTDIEEIKRAEAALQSANDLLEQRVAERTAALRESEERLRFALESCHIGAWDLDLEKHGAFRSLEHDRIFGYTELLPEWTYERFLEHVLPEDRPTVDLQFQQAVEIRGEWNFECQIRRIDGAIRWIWAAGRHQPDVTGVSRRLAGVVQDITERRRAEEALHRAGERLEMAQLAARAGMWDWNVATGTIEWSPRMFEMFGLDPQTATASFAAWTSALHPDDREIAAARIERALAEHTDLNSEYRVVRPDGQVVWINALGRGSYDETGRAVRMAGICIDVTERKRAEQELRERNEELVRFNRGMVGRELRMIELKQEVNDLRAQTGQPPQYNLDPEKT